VRVLIATYHRNVIGGTEKYLQALIPGLIDRGHRVALLYELPFEPARESIVASEHPVATYCLAEEGLTSALRWVSEWKPDVVYNQGLIAGDMEDALLDTYPTVLFAHGYYGTCGTGSKCHAFPRYEPCSRRFGPACLVLHYPRHCGALNPIEAWQTFRLQSQRHARLKDYEIILVASNHMRGEFLRHGVSPDRIRIAPLPLTSNEVETPLSHPGPPCGRILLMGRLTKAKGGHYLIAAIASASRELGQSLVLTVAGDGPERGRLEDDARRFQVATEFVGWIDAPRKAELLGVTDLLAVPSLWPEPFGLVGIEAGILGVPAVGYAVGGIPDWLIPGETGELAPGDPPSVAGLTDAVVRALQSPEHHARLREGARQRALRFTLDAHLTTLEPALALESGRTSPVGYCEPMDFPGRFTPIRSAADLR
jgi:glycosyltransferase involved in cell wall biosynthesis